MAQAAQEMRFEEAAGRPNGAPTRFAGAVGRKTDVDSAVAGCVWTALASPRSSVRWQAAHVTRGLCTLKREKAIESLVQLAKRGEAGAFADARLPFYFGHAKQWFPDRPRTRSAR